LTKSFKLLILSESKVANFVGEENLKTFINY